MPSPAYLFAKGQSSGDVQGSVKVKGRENSVEVLAFHHAVELPTDVQSGRISGVRRHSPFIITKAADKSTPIFYKMACTGEMLTEVKIMWFEIKPDGKEANWYTHTLRNAQITEISSHMANVKEGGAQHTVLMDTIGFRYQEIEWAVTEGGIMAMDNWEQTRD